MRKSKLTLKDKLNHYSQVAKGEKPTKVKSKFSASEQISYAKGQMAARKEIINLLTKESPKTTNKEK